MSHILNQCAEKCQLISAFIEPTCEILKLFGLPFYKKKLSDEVNYAKEVQESIAQLGYLMRVPCSQVRIQICKCIISFYHAEPSKKEFEVYQPISANYKKEMVELGDLAETLVLALTLVENQLPEKLWVIKTLQHLSSSEANCKLMMKAQAPIKLCSHMNDADPSGQLLFRSSEILWNLLEKSSKEEIINQLSNLECVYALKEAFVNLLLHGSRHYDRQLRNDVLVVATLVAQNTGAPMIETGFAKLLILFATFTEVKSHNPLVKGLKITNCYEDFELKKLLLNMLTVLAKDLCTVQLLHEGKVIQALFHYVKQNVKLGVLDWSAAQYEELQLHAIATLATVAPLLIEDYISCSGNIRLLLFLEWCTGNDPFFGQGNCFHGTGGRGTKLAQMHYSLRVLNSIVALCDETVNLDLCDQGAINQLLGILKKTANNYKENDGVIVTEIQTDIFLILATLCENNLHRREIFGWEGVDTLIPFMKIDAKKFYSGLGHNRLLFSVLNCVWCCIIGCTILEDYFLEKEGLFTLLDLLLLNQKHLCNLILGILVELCDNPKTVSHINTWRGKNEQTAANLLINLWRQEEEAMGVKHDKFGRIVGNIPELTASWVMESICVMGSPKTSNETFLPNGINGIKDTAKITIGIIGSGDFAKSLTIRLIRCGYHVVIGSRNPKFAAEFLPHVVDVTHHEDAVAKASLIFVAIHREHYAALWDLKHLLVGKILVDVSNNMRVNQYPESNAEYLASLFPDSIVVKGFNVISAWALQLGPKDASRQVYICSNSIQARQQVMELARQLNFIPLDLGSLSSAREIENVPLRLFTLWKGPVIVAVSLATFFFIYSFIRDAIHPYVKNQQSDFYKIPIEIVNKTLPVVAITLLALVYFSGLLAAAYQLYYGTKYKRFPPWLEDWLQCRKQLGLLSFFFTSVHVVYSLCLPMRRSERYLFLNMAYQQVHANIENSWNEEEVWRIEMYVSFGIMSFGLLSLLAVTSIPSVNKSLNWREFSFIQSTLGYVALLISTFHVLIYGWKRAFEEEYYRFYTPPNFVLALVLPCIVILGKIVLLMPCVSRKFRRIRRGWEKRQWMEDGSGTGSHPSPERVTVM